MLMGVLLLLTLLLLLIFLIANGKNSHAPYTQAQEQFAELQAQIVNAQHQLQSRVANNNHTNQQGYALYKNLRALVDEEMSNYCTKYSFGMCSKYFSIMEHMERDNDPANLMVLYFNLLLDIEVLVQSELINNKNYLDKLLAKLKSLGMSPPKYAKYNYNIVDFS